MSDHPFTLRPVTAEELPAFRRVTAEALHKPDPIDLPPSLLLEPERTLAAFDGERIVGATAHYGLEMAMPGGVREVGGVSIVGVWPTDRRRGVLTALMRRQLAGFRARGVSTAALWASEGGIYERFGYGPAARRLAAQLDLRGLRLRDAMPGGLGALPGSGEVELRFGTAAELLPLLRASHEAAFAARVGEFRRTDAWWTTLRRQLEDKDAPLPRAAVALVGGEPAGHIVYRVRRHWQDHGPADSSAEVVEVYGERPGVRTALWRHLAERDLVTRIEAEMLPVDDVLLHLATDPFRVRALLADSLWLRLVDVAAALTERSWAAPVDTVLEVADRDAPWNAGRWRLRAGPGGAECLPTGAEPDLRLDVSRLAAAYFGAHRLAAAADAGLVDERTPSAAHALDTALTLPRAPHCSVIF
ncbi:GNAT family N-acetyltransferase [Nocardiopsis coralliicola]